MKDFNTKTAWMLNKHKDAIDSIIYLNADGTTTEITLEDFLKADKRHTEEQFRKLKEESDRMFHEEDIAESEQAKWELPLYEWSEKFLSKTLEEEYLGDSEDEAHHQFLARKELMRSLLPDALNTLTETQKRRFILHKGEGYTTRKIAVIERVSQASVQESISGAEKKIKKYLKKNEQTSQKIPCQARGLLKEEK